MIYLVLGGIGNILGASNGGATETTLPAATITTQSLDLPGFDFDTLGTRLQIVLFDGKRLFLNANHTHSVGTIREFLRSYNDVGSQYELYTSYPSNKLSDDTVTLKDGNLLKATIYQK